MTEEDYKFLLNENHRLKGMIKAYEQLINHMFVGPIQLSIPHPHQLNPSLYNDTYYRTNNSNSYNNFPISYDVPQQHDLVDNIYINHDNNFDIDTINSNEHTEFTDHEDLQAHGEHEEGEDETQFRKPTGIALSSSVPVPSNKVFLL